MLFFKHPLALRCLRLHLGLSQAQFANNMEVNVGTVSRWESGDIYPNDKDQEKICAAAHNASVKLNSFGALIALVFLQEKSDPETFGHSERVSLIAEKIAHRLDPKNVKLAGLVSMAGILHDIGKITILSSVMSTKKLMADERREIKTHVDAGIDIIKLVAGNEVARVAREHHEKLDGKGYPKHKRAGRISIGGRILAVADIWEACTAKRKYRKKPMKPERVKKMMREDKGLDQNLVKILIATHPTIRSKEDSVKKAKKYDGVERRGSSERRKKMNKDRRQKRNRRGSKRSTK